jgi:hypothetical protein
MIGGAMFLSQIIAAGAGFLISVLWFDLMFDVQVLAHRREPALPASVLDSISGYYHRVTETASPMGRLVATVMLTLLVALTVQAARSDVPASVSVSRSQRRSGGSGWPACACSDRPILWLYRAQSPGAPYATTWSAWWRC